MYSIFMCFRFGKLDFVTSFFLYIYYLNGEKCEKKIKEKIFSEKNENDVLICSEK